MFRNQPININSYNDLNIQLIDFKEKDVFENFVASYQIVGFGVTKKSESVCVKINNFRPFFYVQIPDGIKWKKFMKSEFVENLAECTHKNRFTGEEKLLKFWVKSMGVELCKYTIFDGFQNHKKSKFLKLSFTSLKGRKLVENHIAKNNVLLQGKQFKLRLFETDISPLLRFFHFKEINPSGWIKLPENMYSESIDKLSTCQYECEISWTDIESIQNCNDIAPLLIASFDIECTSHDGESFPNYEHPKDKIIQIGTTVEKFGDPDYSYNFITSLGTCDKIDGAKVVECVNETEVILKWVEFIEQMNPDVIIGWNTYGFDYQYIKERSALLGIEEHIRLSRLDEQSKYRKKELQSAAMGCNELKFYEIPGRINIDLIKYVRSNVKLDSYKLDNVAKHYLNDSKDAVSPTDIFKLQDGDSKDRCVVAKYCIQDCKLVNRLFNKLCVLENTIGMANTCIVPLEYIFSRGQGIKTYSLVAKECRGMGYIIPLKDKSKSNEGFKGATVLSAMHGAHFYPVSCLDFASLYPSCMISHNLCISSIVTDPKLLNLPGVEYRTVEWEEDGFNKKHIYAQPLRNKDGILIEDDRAVLPQILKKLLAKRKATKKKKKNETDPFKKMIWDGLQLSYKVTANSIYGQLGASTGSFSKVAVAASVTTTGRQLLEYAQDIILKNYEGSVAVYGDSVTPDTPLLLRYPDGRKTIKTIENLSNNWINYNEFKPFDTNRTDKEQSTTNLEVWANGKWSKIKRVIRHKCNKKINRVLTHTGVVDVTEDHSLLNEKCEIIKTKDCNIGTKLLQSYPLFNNNKPLTLNEIVNRLDNLDTSIINKKAFLYGFFYGDGSCGKYNTKSGIKYTWAFNNQDKKALEIFKVWLTKIYNQEFKILETIESSNVYKLVPIGTIKKIVNIFRPLFYDNNKYKIVPEEILNGSYQERLDFFLGYYFADGYKCRNINVKNITLSNKGKIGTSHLFYLMRTLNYKVSINTREDKLNIYKLTACVTKLRKTENKIKKIIDLGYTNDFVYDLETEEGRFQAGIGTIIAKNTDSVFIKFQLKDHNENCLFHKNNIDKRIEKFHQIKENIVKKMKINEEDFLHTRDATAMMFKTDYKLYSKCECSDYEPMSKEALTESIRMAKEADKISTSLLPYPHELEYEKTYQPYILFSKKRYVGKLYEEDPDKYYLDYKGIVLKRRDNCGILKKLYKGCLNPIMDGKPDEAFDFLEKTLNNMLKNHKTKEFPTGDFVISKTLKSLKQYKKMEVKLNQDCPICKTKKYGKRNTSNTCNNMNHRINLGHVMLTEKIKLRDDEENFNVNDRIPYCFVAVKDKKLKKLQGNRIETPFHIEKYNKKLDYLYYIEKQLENPITQLFQYIDHERVLKILKSVKRIEKNKQLGVREITSFFTKNKKKKVVIEDSEDESEQDEIIEEFQNINDEFLDDYIDDIDDMEDEDFNWPVPELTPEPVKKVKKVKKTKKVKKQIRRGATDKIKKVKKVKKTKKVEEIPIDYSKMKVTELKKLCKERKIKNYSKMKKTDLVSVLSV